MLDFFAILTKGGIVLWSSRSTNQVFTHPVNSLIKNNILQERAGAQSFDCDAIRLHYKLDNELELIYIVAYQKILQLTYIDKFLGDVQTEFREKCKPQLPLSGGMDFDFALEYQQILAEAENWARLQLQEPKQMRSYVESQKSKKTVGSMFEPKNKETESTTGKTVKIDVKPSIPEQAGPGSGVDLIAISRQKLKEQINVKKKPEAKKPSTKPVNAKSSKKPRVWDLNENSRYMPELDWSKDKSNGASSGLPLDSEIVGSMQGVIKDLENESDEEQSPDEVDDSSPSDAEHTKTTSTGKQAGLFSLFKGLVGSKNLKRSDIEQSLEKFQDHLIGKNVAADIAHQLCESVAAQLEGRVLGTFESIASIVKATLTDSLVKILSPKRRVDILRDCYEAKKEGRPYVMSFCGVNGVGKSTNLSKICFWLIENDYNVLIAACDTFRAGAIEQLRTHTRHLNTLHPPEKHEGRTMVQLYERGYGKDAAGIAMEAIRFAKDTEIDVVLIDTAGRMQDNEPLMRALAKLIQVNNPDLVLFVGEALVGNEAVDQLVKFNQSLSDFSSSQNARIIDGIVLTKFDTIDDKVGAAISMTYITGQPIVFVGTGQSYSDLKALNAKSVVHALLK